MTSEQFQSVGPGSRVWLTNDCQAPHAITVTRLSTSPAHAAFGYAFYQNSAGGESVALASDVHATEAEALEASIKALDTALWLNRRRLALLTRVAA